MSSKTSSALTILPEGPSPVKRKSHRRYAENLEVPPEAYRAARVSINRDLLKKINPDEFDAHIRKVAAEIPLTPTALRAAATWYIASALGFRRVTINGAHMDAFYIDCLTQADVNALVSILLNGG